LMLMLKGDIYGEGILNIRYRHLHCL
jgi:hypothetical protein